MAITSICYNGLASHEGFAQVIDFVITMSIDLQALALSIWTNLYRLDCSKLLQYSYNDLTTLIHRMDYNFDTLHELQLCANLFVRKWTSKLI
jgi:hypothetical protein